MNEKSVGENIRTIRLASRASLTEVAKRAKLTKSTLSKIENGQISSPIATLLPIAAALGVKLGEFFREAGRPGPDDAGTVLQSLDRCDNEMLIDV